MTPNSHIYRVSEAQSRDTGLAIRPHRQIPSLLSIRYLYRQILILCALHPIVNLKWQRMKEIWPTMFLCFWTPFCEQTVKMWECPVGRCHSGCCWVPIVPFRDGVRTLAIRKKEVHADTLCDSSPDWMATVTDVLFSAATRRNIYSPTGAYSACRLGFGIPELRLVHSFVPRLLVTWALMVDPGDWVGFVKWKARHWYEHFQYKNGVACKDYTANRLVMTGKWPTVINVTRNGDWKNGPSVIKG